MASKLTVKFSPFVSLLRHVLKMTRAEAKFLSRHVARQWKIYDKKSFSKVFAKAWALKRTHFELTDLGNGKRIAEEHHEVIRYCEETDTWLVWDGIRWLQMVSKANKLILQKAEESVDKIKAEADALPEGEEKKKLTAFWKQCHSYGSLKAMIRAATLDDRVSIAQKDLDTYPHLLNCVNFMVDLTRAKALAHDRRKYITQAVPHAFNPKAKCKHWKKFLRYATGNDKAMMKFLQILAGYILTGEVREKSLIVLLGVKDTGKTTFLETIRTILGDDFACPADFKSFVKTRNSKAIRNDIAGFRKARLVTAAEGSEEESFDAALLKMLTGGDTIAARLLFQEYIRFKATFKIVLATNEMPKIPLSDEAAWGRFIIVPFDRQADSETLDRSLGNKLMEEAEGILAWAIEGARLYYEEGLKVPQKVKDAKDELRGVVDPLAGFLAECCEESPKAKTTTGKLYKAWKVWCSKNVYPAGKKASFGKLLSSKGYKNKRVRITVKGKEVQRHALVGLKLIEKAPKSPKPVKIKKSKKSRKSK